jgi:phage gp36-like protein
MNYLVIEDFDTIISRELLYNTIDYPESGAPEQAAAMAKLSGAVAAAISEASGYLNNRYDTTNIFNKTGTNRNAFLVLKLCDMAIYHVLTINNPESMTELRKDRYDYAITVFEKINKMELNIPDLPIPSDDSKSQVFYGSNERRNNHF